MKPRIYRMNWFVRLITLNWPIAITLAPFGIYIKDEYFNDPEIRNHEKIHWMQQMEMFIVFFYLWYLIEWFIKWITPPRGAYIDIGFEREAKSNENNSQYNKSRKWFAWRKYITKIEHR